MAGFINQPFGSLRGRAGSLLASIAPSEDQFGGFGARGAAEPSRQGRERSQPLRVSFLVAVGFALIYALMKSYPPLAALSILALLPCVLYRVDERQRRIAQAPLTFAALMLTQKIFSARIIGFPGYGFSTWQAPWVPLFLGVCLYYMPQSASWSRNLLLGLGALVLLTGLLPGTGFTVAFAAVEYLLFIAVAIALGMDFFGAREHGARQAIAK